MSVLLLTLAGPLQAWGDSSRFERRATRHEPTKSGVLGLVAASQGRPRDADLSDLGLIRFGVRVDQEGTLLRDYQTAKHPKWANPKLSYRYYLQDALFVAALEGEQPLLASIAEAVRSPEFPLYLGRRACPPSRPLVLDLVDGELEGVLDELPWQAAEWYRARHTGDVRLRVVRDARAGEHSIETVRDVPVSFSPERRTYEWRDVVETWVEIPAEIDAAADEHEGSGAALTDLPATRGAGSGPPARPSTPDAFDELI